MAYLLIAIYFGQARAQSPSPPPVTINQAVQEAIEKNLGLLAERYAISIADARIITAGLRPNPVLSIEGDHLDLLGTGYNEINKAGPPEYSIRTDFIFERGGKRRHRLDVAQQEKQVAQMQLLNATRALVLDVENAFVDVLLAKESLRLAQDNLTAFNNIVRVNVERVRAGDLARVELTRTQLAELQFNNAVIQAVTKVRIAQQRLQLLMGRAVPSPSFEVSGEMRREPLPFSLENLQQQAMARRPDYQAMLRDQARSQAEILLQLAQRKVDFTVGTEYRRQQGLAGKGNSLGFFFSIPLPVFNRNQGEISRAQEEQLQIDARLHALEAEIRNEINTAWQQYETARTLLSQIESEMLGRARRVLETIDYSYRSGEASFVDLLDARRAFNDTMQSYNEARAEYARSLYLIDSTIGKDTVSVGN
ncbi:MAG: TolC family protein [Blastocatellia bacterium]|nr:TolC family protein [Blastocatellia bacterium]